MLLRARTDSLRARTTFGKEMANVGARLRRARARFVGVEVLAKWNGAVGNYNAHLAARRDVDWIAVSRAFIESQRLTWNAYSTQIEPHDWIGEYCDACSAVNTLLIDLCRDLWGYVALGYLRQTALAGEVGSSTMPHKVNPIDFENAEGNLGLANALLRFFSDKLPISRWQRDLSDSTVLRNIGTALAHALIGYKSLQRGLGKITPDAERMAQELEGAYEILAEAIQSVLRAHGVPHGYELLRDLTRGARVNAASLRELIATLPLPEPERARLAALRPAEYVGLAADLARSFARGKLCTARPEGSAADSVASAQGVGADCDAVGNPFLALSLPSTLRPVAAAADQSDIKGKPRDDHKPSGELRARGRAAGPYLDSVPAGARNAARTHDHG